MSGGLHLFFGALFGLALWHFSTGKDGKKRWSFALVLLFMLNNYIGPDIEAVFEPLAELAQNEIFYLAISAIHSYLGYILFAPLWAALWYAIFAWIGRKQVKKFSARGEATMEPVYLHSYSDVFLVVLIGGFSHHFVDLLGHVKDVEGTPYVRGRFGLLFFEWGVPAAVFGIIAAIIVGSVILHYIRVVKPTRQQFGQKFLEILCSRQSLKVLVFFVIGLLNTWFLYLVMAQPLQTGTVNFPGSEYLYTVVYFNLAFALRATSVFASGTAAWYLVICAIGLVVGFLIAYSKRKKVTLFGHSFRVELLVFIGFLVAMLVGYLLQPVIGNISNAEADFGLLVFLWSTVGTILLGAAAVHARVHVEAPDTEEKSKPMAQ